MSLLVEASNIFKEDFFKKSFLPTAYSVSDIDDNDDDEYSHCPCYKLYNTAYLIIAKMR